MAGLRFENESGATGEIRLFLSSFALNASRMTVPGGTRYGKNIGLTDDGSLGAKNQLRLLAVSCGYHDISKGDRCYGAVYSPKFGR